MGKKREFMFNYELLKEYLKEEKTMMQIAKHFNMTRENTMSVMDNATFILPVYEDYKVMNGKHSVVFGLMSDKWLEGVHA